MYMNHSCLKRSVRVFVFLLILGFVITGCFSTGKAGPSLEEQVQSSYEDYMMLLDAGVTSMMELRLVDGHVEGRISRPTEEDLEFFFMKYTEDPLCQDCDEQKEVVACLIEILKEQGCVRIATCGDCIYSCE